MLFTSRVVRTACLSIGLLLPVIAQAAAPEASGRFDRNKAARVLGYASEVFTIARCPDQKDVANSLSDDILAYWKFSAEDTEGRTSVGRLVAQGRALARRESRAPCGKLDAELAAMRSEVLPR